MPTKSKPLKVLLDTSVIISGLNSKTGASTGILTLSKQKTITIFITPYILEEAASVIRRKFPKLLPYFKQLVGADVFDLIPNPPAAIVKRAAKIISDLKDAAILSTAIEEKVDFLITLDRKHFIDDPTVARKSDLKIVLPKDFIKLFR